MGRAAANAPSRTGRRLQLQPPQCQTDGTPRISLAGRPPDSWSETMSPTGPAPHPNIAPGDEDSTGMPDLAQWIRAGDTVVCGQAAAEPLGLTRALVAQRHRFPGARVFLGAVFSRSFEPAHADVLRFTGYGAMGRAAALFDADGGSIVPIHYRELEASFASGRL